MELLFDLQLFAEEADGTEGAEGAEGTESAAIEGGEGQEAGGESKAQAVRPDGKGGQTLLGRTDEKAEEYDFKSVVPEGMVYDAQQAEAFSAVAREMNLSGEQASQLAAYGMKYAQQAAGAYEDARVREVQGWAQEAKDTLGIDYDQTIAKAGAGMEALEKVIPNLRAAMNYTGAGNRIEFIQMLAFVGDLTKEDNFRGFGANSGAVRSNLYGKTNFGLY